VTIEDGLANDAFGCAVPACSNPFGEWTALNVNNGATYPNGIKVVLTILGREVPNGATVDTIDLIHVLDNGSAYTITERCDGDGLNSDGHECITVTKNGNNFQVVAWLLSNGGTRFGY